MKRIVSSYHIIIISETINHVLPMTTCKLSHVIRKLSKKWDLLEVPEASPKKTPYPLVI
jgi:hypothetical protein